MQLHMHSLDLALVAGFIALWIAVIVFRRFHQYETFVDPKELGPTAWGLYGPNEPKKAAASGSRHKKENIK